MADAARAASARKLLKIKLGGAGDPERIAAVRQAAPHSELIVDANEGWTAGQSRRQPRGLRRGRRHAGRAAAAGRRRRGARRRSGGRSRSAPTKACTTALGLAALVGRYDAVNIKLDKTGGLTEALAMAQEARAARLRRHGRLHGCDLARHGARHAGGAARARGRSRRAAAAGEGPPGRATLRGQPGLSADARACGADRC